MNLSIVIATYNAENTIEALFAELKKVLEREGLSFEIIFVEDCGQDNTWGVITRLNDIDNRVRGIKLSRNYGQHNAILCGIRESKGEIIVTLDDDLQNPPEEIPRLIDKLTEGYDVVYGVSKNKAHGFFRNVASKMTKVILSEVIGSANAKNISPYRAFRTKIRSAFEHYKSPSVNIDVLLTWGTTNFGAIEVRQDDRLSGNSGYSYAKLIRHAFNMITGFSTLPLKVASALGFSLSVFGIVMLFYVFFRYFYEGGSVPGFPFLASLVCIFSGAQLLVLGVIGEYIARIYHRTMEQPAYLISKKL